MLLLSYCNFFFFSEIYKLDCLILSWKVSCVLVKNMHFAICNAFLYFCYPYSIIQTGESVEWGVCWGMFSLNKAEE